MLSIIFGVLVGVYVICWIVFPKITKRRTERKLNKLIGNEKNENSPYNLIEGLKDGKRR